MKKIMKKISRTIVMSAVAGFLLTGAAAAEEEKPTADLSISALSQYIWRGWAYSRDSMVIQPSMTVGYKGFAFNLWGNLDTEQYNPAAGGDETSDWTETDLTLSYDNSYGKIGYGLGYIYYALEPANTTAEDTQEVYCRFSYDTLLTPTLTIFRDIDSTPSWYVLAGISHSLPITEKISLDLSAQVSYYNFDDVNDMAEVTNVGAGTVSATEEYNAFHDGVLSAALTIPVVKYITVTPKVYWSFPLSSEASDRLELSNNGVIAEYEDNFVYGGVTLDFSF